MSSPKTLSYELSPERLRQIARERQQAEQEKTMEAGILRWQLRQAQQKAESLAQEIRCFQQAYPELACRVSPPQIVPAHGNTEALKAYLEELEIGSVTLRDALQEIRTQARVRETMAGLADAALVGTISAADALAGFEAAPTAISGGAKEETSVEYSQAIAGVREKTTEAVSAFLTRESAPLPAEVADLVDSLIASTDLSEATNLAMRIRSGLTVESKTLQQAKKEEKEEAKGLRTGLAPLLRELRELQSTASKQPGYNIEAQAACQIAQELDGILHKVIQGEGRLDQHLRNSIKEMHKEMADRKHQQGEAAAGILREAFTNLGYKIEPIQNTLLVEGGTVHFRQENWPAEYFVRMRVDRENFNFNVVRAVEDPDREAEQGANQGQKEKDTAMENLWCSQISALLRQIQLDGIETSFIRRLPAGEVPMQIVNRTAIPESLQQTMGQVQMPAAPQQKRRTAQ